MRVACIQLNVGPDEGENLPTTLSLIEQAAKGGAALIATPEATNLLRRPGTHDAETAKTYQQNETFTALCQAAAEHKCWLLIGSLLVAGGEDNRLLNRQFLINPTGQCVAQYSKMHMFDVDIPDGQSYGESLRYSPGDDLVVTPIADAFTLGHAICYDMRFPEMLQQLCLAGANLLVLPSAFTQYTGEAHWHTLVRARAIENGAYVLAPAQCGLHDGGRESYGHSLIVDPWGKILAEADTHTPGVIFASLSVDATLDARKKVPNLANRRPELYHRVQTTKSYSVFT